MPLAVEIAGLIALLGFAGSLWGLFSPESLTIILERFANRGGMWFGAIMRLVFGVALWFAAAETSVVVPLRIFAVLVFAAGVGFPLMGLDRFKSMMGWWQGKSHGFIRAWCVLGLVLMGGVLWVLAPFAPTS